MQIEEIKKFVGHKLREARKESGYSQEELAERLGLGRVGYGDLERGRNLISLEHLLKLPRILGKPITYFLPNSAVTEAERGDSRFDPLLGEILEAWPGLGREGREVVRDMVRAIMGRRPRLRLVADGKEAEYEDLSADG